MKSKSYDKASLVVELVHLHKCQSYQNVDVGTRLAMFVLEYEDIISTINQINVPQYGKTRHYIIGAVSKLSPFITHSVISSHQITRQLLQREMENKSTDEAYKNLELYIFLV